MSFDSMPFRENDIRLNDHSEKLRSELLIFFNLTIRIYDDWVERRSAISLFGKKTSR